MFPKKKKEPKYQPGTTIRVIQWVRIGHLQWKTQTTGEVVQEGVRPIGGMEMGTKSMFITQPTIMLRYPDGELTEVALDERTEVEVISAPGVAAEPNELETTLESN